MKRLTSLLLACIMLLLCLAGCGSTSSDTGSDSTPAADAGTDAAADAATADAPDIADAEEGLLRMATLSDVQSMDVTQTTSDYFIPMNVYDRLFEIAVADDGSTSIVNSLCEDYQVSDDGLTYTFKLREGVKFSNGNDMTAEDVAFSFTRLLTAGGVNDDIALEIVGAEALENGEAESLEGLVVNDDYSLSITLNAANAGFLAELTAVSMSVLDKETVEAADDIGTNIDNVIGTGPYKITEWVTNDHFTLEYNDQHWGEKPSVTKCICYIIPDASTQNLMFQKGNLDIIDLDRVDASIIASTYETNYADQIIVTPRVGLTYFALNNTQEFLSDLNVRKAIQMCINRQEIIDSVYGGRGIVENGIIPTGVVGHNDNNQDAIKYDPEAAKALLAEAGYNEGDISFELSLDSTANSKQQLTYQVIQQNLKDIGINAEIASYDESSWLDIRKSGEMDSFINTWTMDYNDPANIMYTFFGSPDKTAIRSLNYADTAIMDRVAAASTIINDDERYAEYQSLEQKIVVDDAAWVPLFEQVHLYCISDRVDSFQPHWAGYTDFYVIGVTMK
ncbi:MAG: ABC transporter substrate-binding protein [Oscillospiraceae bacterium]|nr:ABC transporter substrate-binding protein [Oscillospiraceae bacterium]